MIPMVCIKTNVGCSIRLDLYFHVVLLLVAKGDDNKYKRWI